MISIHISHVLYDYQDLQVQLVQDCLPYTYHITCQQIVYLKLIPGKLKVIWLEYYYNVVGWVQF